MHRNKNAKVIISLNIINFNTYNNSIKENKNYLICMKIRYIPTTIKKSKRILYKSHKRIKPNTNLC